METKLEYMKRVLKELEEELSAVTTKALHIADELNLPDHDDDPGAFEVILKLRHEVRIGEEYTKPFAPRAERTNGRMKTCSECGKVSGDGSNKHYATCGGRPEPI